MRLYAYPKLSKYDFGSFGISGPGLGNMLFPWARAVVYAKEKGCKILAPAWVQIKPRRIFTMDPDQRNYKGYFISNKYIVGVLKNFIRIVFPSIPEGELKSKLTGGVVCFKGMDGLFDDLMPYREYVREQLWDITSSQYKKSYNEEFGEAICIHVRLGDFKAASQDACGGETNTRITMSWYVEILKRLRKLEGCEDKVAYVFSDGEDEELSALLSLSNVKRVRLENALTELWALSSGRFLIASGSTFSMWACFLGNMDTYWYPGQLKLPHKFHGSKRINVEVEG